MKRPLALSLVLAGAASGFLVSGGASGLLATFTGTPSHATAEAARAELRNGVDLEVAFERVAEAVQPSVVSIATTRNLVPTRMSEDDPFFGSPFHRFNAPQGEGLKQRGLGSGVLVAKDGTILTNNHVVEGMDELQVHLADGRVIEGRVLGTDPRTDIAVVKIDAENLLPAALGDSSQVRVGQWVAAFGSPFGLEQSLTSGIISAKGRSRVGITDIEDFLQTDAAINRGNSGGPLVNLKGEVIGINTAIFSQSGMNAGVSFAITSNLARQVMDRILAEGRVVRGFLGVMISEVTPDLGKRLSVNEGKGVVVAEVTPRSPADRAGLSPEDVILSIDGQEISDVTAFRNHIAAKRPGSELRIVLVRDGNERELTATVGELGPETRVRRR